MKIAIETISKGCSIREASKKFHIPYTTLHSHLNNNVHHNVVGRPTKFNSMEEECLENAAIVLQVSMRQFSLTTFTSFFFQKWGVPLCINEFLNLAKQYAISLQKQHVFPSNSPTYDWLRSFLQRHENLVLKKSRPLEKKRAAITLDQVNEWFDLLSKIINDNHLENHPGQIFNCDESGNQFV